MSSTSPQYGHIALTPRTSEYVPERLLGTIDCTVFVDGEIRRGSTTVSARTLAEELETHLADNCVGICDGAYVSTTMPREAVELAVEYVADSYSSFFDAVSLDSEAVVSAYLTGVNYRDWPTRPPSMTTSRGRYRVAIPVAALLFEAFQTEATPDRSWRSATAQQPQHR
jgi:hypothetical protein